MACPPGVRQRLPERFKGWRTKVFLAASPTPEPSGQVCARRSA